MPILYVIIFIPQKSVKNQKWSYWTTHVSFMSIELVFIWVYLRYILYQGHTILNIKLNGWIFLCILQEISILFLPESARY